MDVMSDTLSGGRRFRTLNILDEGIREGLAIEVDMSLPAERVIRALEQVVAWRGHPRPFGLTMAPNCSPIGSSPGVRTEASSCGTSSQATPRRTASSNGSIGRIVPKC